MNESYSFDEPEHFTTGTVGPKGERVFFLQADDGSGPVSLKLEKQQVAALAEYLARLLADVPVTGDSPPSAELAQPVVAAWVVGPLGVAYDETNDRIIVVAEELVEDEDDPSASARFAVRRDQAQAFVQRARDIVSAGRDPCPYCGRPLEPGTTWCPCHN